MLEALGSLHGILARALELFALVLGLWGTFLYFRNAALNGGFRASYLLMGGLAMVQGLLGGIVFAGGSRPHELLHVVYGVFAVIFVPGVYLYAQPPRVVKDAPADARVDARAKKREALLLAGAAWIVLIAYFRGIATS